MFFIVYEDIFSHKDTQNHYIPYLKTTFFTKRIPRPLARNAKPIIFSSKES